MIFRAQGLPTVGEGPESKKVFHSFWLFNLSFELNDVLQDKGQKQELFCITTYTQPLEIYQLHFIKIGSSCKVCDVKKLNHSKIH